MAEALAPVMLAWAGMGMELRMPWAAVGMELKLAWAWPGRVMELMLAMAWACMGHGADAGMGMELMPHQALNPWSQQQSRHTRHTAQELMQELMQVMTLSHELHLIIVIHKLY